LLIGQAGILPLRNSRRGDAVASDLLVRDIDILRLGGILISRVSFHDFSVNWFNRWCVVRGGRRHRPNPYNNSIQLVLLWFDISVVSVLWSSVPSF